MTGRLRFDLLAGLRGLGTRFLPDLVSDALAKLRREYFGFIFQRYHLLPSARGEFLEKLGRFDEAKTEFERAALMSTGEPGGEYFRALSISWRSASEMRAGSTVSSGKLGAAE